MSHEFQISTLEPWFLAGGQVHSRHTQKFSRFEFKGGALFFEDPSKALQKKPQKKFLVYWNKTLFITNVDIGRYRNEINK